MGSASVTLALLRFMPWNWPPKFCQIGPLSLLPSVDIPKQAAIDAFLEPNLLPVGRAKDGGLVVIDFSVESCPVGFVRSLVYDADGALREYGDVSPQELREYFQPAALSVESFLSRVYPKVASCLVITEQPPSSMTS